VGEVAQAHDGSLGLAHSYIDAVARAGADAVKFQTHIATEESTPEEPWRVRFSKQDETRYEYWQRMEFTAEQWAGLKQHAEDEGLIFLSSPFSVAAAELLERIGIVGWKLASGEVSNPRLIDFLLRTDLPTMISTGMSSYEEIDLLAGVFADHAPGVALFQCTSVYPCPPEKVGLNLVRDFRERYGCPVGLSDHSGTIYPSLAATVMGVDVLEVHVTLSRDMAGPDLNSSVTASELGQIAAGIRFIEAMINNPAAKNTIAEDLTSMRRLFTKSVVAASDLAAGTVLTSAHLAIKKPGTGIPAQDLDSLVGRRLIVGVHRDQILQEDDLEKEAR